MKLVTVVGARPQFVKAATVSRALADLGRGVDEILVHTGQHYDTRMSEQFFRDLDLPKPAYNLGVGSGPHGAQTGEMLWRLEEVLASVRPDAVAVYGDTNSTLAGALAAAKLCIPLAHVEAGMRSFDRRAPEEVNRVVTDHLASLLMCATEAALGNLATEGITRGAMVVGNVMYDALLENVRRAEQQSSVLQQLAIDACDYYLATVHRAENTDDPLRLASIVHALQILSERCPVIWPVHPRTAGRLVSLDILPAGPMLRVLEPASYLDMLVLEKHARAILTDAGGVTNEAFWFGVPCITLRDQTEWVETVAGGWNTLVGADTERIVQASQEVRRPVAPAVATSTRAAGASARVARALAGM